MPAHTKLFAHSVVLMQPMRDWLFGIMCGVGWVSCVYLFIKDGHTDTFLGAVAYPWLYRWFRPNA